MIQDIFEFDDRRPSTITLLHPNYGYSDDEDSEDENSAGSDERFLVPGDDEEELLESLNPLPPEKVDITSKIIGQGMQISGDTPKLPQESKEMSDSFQRSIE